MVLPKDFILHETRLSKDALEGIEFQFERIGLDSKNIKIFLERFLKIAQSPTLPPDDYEVIYLASKVAYMLANYEFFTSETFKQKEMGNDGSRIWYALAKAAQGEVESSLKILEDVKKNTENSGDILHYIEVLGVLAQIYFVRGSKEKAKLEKIMNEIEKFKEKHQLSLPDFNHIFLPAYLIEERIISQQLPPREIINEVLKLHKITEEINDNYWHTQIELDLSIAYLQANELQESESLLKHVFETLAILKFSALEAKAVRIQGELFEKKKDYSLAEKNYLEAKELYSKLKDQIGVSSCVLKLAELTYKKDDKDQAEQFYTESYNISQNMNDSYGEAVALSALAKITSNKSQYAEALATYKKAHEIANENKFEYLLPSILDGLAYVNFITGDFWSAVENRSRAVIYKEKLAYNNEELLIEHMKLGQLNAIVGNLERAFEEFEQALNLTVKLGKKDEIYFDILNWLFEISTALGKMSLADSYISRADLFASIHNSPEENVQAIISRIRFHIQKRELKESEKLLEAVFEKAQEFPSALTMSLALTEKANVLLLRYLENPQQDYFDEVISSVEDMVFISLDLEFLPLTMYAKRLLGKILAFKDKFDEGIEEIEEAIGLAQELGMQKFEDTLNEDIKIIKIFQDKKDSLSEKESQNIHDELLANAIDILKQTFWLVNASEHQRI
ncbi:MAG TPA: tetratricopeptide repeat protein [candidate division Zixibacteria bacterium]|nr:tetratricopeptide repeat protein [candidate division Zixibacteria bacterium]